MVRSEQLLKENETEHDEGTVGEAVTLLSNSPERSMRADANVLRWDYKRKHIQLVLIG